MKKNKKQRKLHSYDIAQVGLICAVFCIVCPIAFVVPISPVPVSFSLVALYLSVYLVGTRKALMGCGLYLLIGAIGIPVFTGFQAGPSALIYWDICARFLFLENLWKEKRPNGSKWVQWF